jgi:hypothetical protein
MTLDEITGGSPYGATQSLEATAHAGPQRTNCKAHATRGGGLNSRVSNWPTAVFNAMEALRW